MNSVCATNYTFALEETRDGLFIQAHFAFSYRPSYLHQIVTSTATSHMLPYQHSGPFTVMNFVRVSGGIVGFSFTERVVSFSTDINATETISIAPSSAYSRFMRNTMLLPPSEADARFRLIAHVTDPGQLCIENSLGFTPLEAGDGVRFRASVSIIEPTGLILDSTYTSPMETFAIYTSNVGDVIPSEIYTRIMSQIRAVSGESDIEEIGGEDWTTTFMHLLPSIEYTLQTARGGSSPVRIVLNPEDYIRVNENGVTQLNFSPSTELDGNRISLQTLKLFGVYFDYRNDQLGFCDPLF